MVRMVPVSVECLFLVLASLRAPSRSPPHLKRIGFRSFVFQLNTQHTHWLGGGGEGRGRGAGGEGGGAQQTRLIKFAEEAF